jgi:hypothetical protein
MTPQEIVRSRFPRAEAIYREPVYVLGQREPYRQGGWFVFSVRALGAEQLGSGPTEEAAWRSAAAVVSEQAGAQRLGFKEWLTAQAKREGSAEERRRVIEEWKGSVADLFAQVIRWLAEEDTEKVLEVQSGTTQREEEGLGAYDVLTLRIILASRFVDLIPLGRNVVGGIGPKGDIGLRAEGRIDMRSRTRKHMIFRVASGEGKKWVLVNDDDYTIRDLDKDTFESALQDLLS